MDRVLWLVGTVHYQSHKGKRTTLVRGATTEDEAGDALDRCFEAALSPRFDHSEPFPNERFCVLEQEILIMLNR